MVRHGFARRCRLDDDTQSVRGDYNPKLIEIPTCQKSNMTVSLLNAIQSTPIKALLKKSVFIK
jgi:hypothetical protein